jgi:putative flippase GtrA
MTRTLDSTTRAKVSPPRSGRRRASTDLRRQGFRFVLAGTIVFLVYVGTTTFLAEVIGVPFEAALAIGFALAILTHFSLQRLFVWRNDTAFALPLHHQVARYAAVAGSQYGLTAAITATLPSALGVSPEAVYLPTVVLLSGLNFLVLRSRVFHAAADQLDQ